MQDQNAKDIEFFKNCLEKAPSLISLVTAGAIIGGLLFNLGYFLPIGLEYITFLSLRDYIESTLPFFVLGPLYYVLMSLLDLKRKEGIITVFDSYKDFFEAGRLYQNILVAIVATPFFLIQVFGVYIVYYFVYCQASRVIQRIADFYQIVPASHGILYLSLLVSLVIIGADLFIQARPPEYKIRKVFMRAVLLMAYFNITGGMSYVLYQAKEPPAWAIYSKGNSPTNNVVFLRSMEKGILYFVPRTSTISFIYSEEVNRINYTINYKNKGSENVP